MPCSRRCNNSERGTQSHFEPNAVWISVLSASAAGCVWSMGRNNRIIEGDATWKRLAPTPAGVHWDTGRNSITWNCRPSWPKRPQYPCCNVLCQMNAACFAREQASPVCTWQQYWTLTICQINIKLKYIKLNYRSKVPLTIVDSQLVALVRSNAISTFVNSVYCCRPIRESSTAYLIFQMKRDNCQAGQ